MILADGPWCSAVPDSRIVPRPTVRTDYSSSHALKAEQDRRTLQFAQTSSDTDSYRPAGSGKDATGLLDNRSPKGASYGGSSPAEGPSGCPRSPGLSPC